jgi:hypothetical protein
MNDIQKMPQLKGRPETGPMQFGDDWPGVFIRGDIALFDACAVMAAVERLSEADWLLKAQLIGLAKTLRCCVEGVGEVKVERPGNS